jgi:hypothetical protein
MIASIFLLFVAAGICFGSLIFGFGSFGIALIALSGASLLIWSASAYLSRTPTA